MTQIDRLQGLSGGLAIKAPVRVATTAAITKYGLKTIDGVALASGDAVLVKNQASAKENGIWLADTGAWRRREDWDGIGDVTPGTQVLVVEGTRYASAYFQTNAATREITPGVTDVTFALPTLAAALVANTEKLAKAIYVTDPEFGAVGDGTDATAAFIAALATGKSVIVPDGDYVITAALHIAGPGQRIIGNSRASRIFPQGSFDVFNFSGFTEGQGIEKLYVNAIGMSGGNLINVDSTNSLKFKDLIVLEPWNFAYLIKTDNCVFNDVLVGGIRGDYGIKWYGYDTAKSDNLRLTGVVLGCSPTARPTGIIWDGYCQTLRIQTTSIINAGYGIRIMNTSGGEDPQFLFSDSLEIEFPLYDGIRVEAGQHFYFTPSLHIHGSALGSGIYVYDTTPSDVLAVTGGKITGHARYGVEMADYNKAFVGGNVYFEGNGLGDVAGIFRSKAERFAVDDVNFLGKDTSGNPIQSFDANDYLVYNRATNTLSFVIGASIFLSIGSALANYANDGAAAAGGIPLYGYYRNGSVIMQRVA